MFKEKIYPYILVSIQLSSLVFILLSGPRFAKNWDGLLVEAAGVILGVWAIYVAGVHNVNVAPKPKPGGVLITHGPYRILRHPMYLAQVVAIIPLVELNFTPLRLGVLILLIITLLLKINYEEKGLIGQFGAAYKAYQKKSFRVLPYIY
jgi:protein-S-isoprenylcysteine O-methyltransferase Ste14